MTTELHIIVATENDSDNWNAFVNSHPNSSPYQQYGWMQSVEDAYGFKNLPLCAKRNNHIVGIFPMVIMQSPTGRKSLCSLPYCDVGGILADDKETEQGLFNHGQKLISEYGQTSLTLRQTQYEASDVNALDPHTKVRMVLPLPESADALMASFRSKLRSQIKKASKNGLTYTIYTGSEATSQIDKFYKVISANMRDLGSPVHSKKWFTSVLSRYQNNAIMGLVWKDDIVVGSGIILLNKDSAAIPWASTLRDYNRLAPNMLLYWGLLEAACERQAKWFDFGRSSPDSGTFKFKQQWGAQPFKLEWKNVLISEVQEIESASVSKLRQNVEAIWQKLPLGVANLFGPIIRKYISL